MDASKLGPLSEQLLVRYIANQTSDEESEQVLHWCELDANNQIYLDQLFAAWEKSLALAPKRLPDVEASLERLKSKAGQKNLKNSSAKIIFNWRWLSVAAVLVCFPAFVWFYSISKSSRPIGQKMTQTSSKPDTLTLADGSAITLNRNSRIVYDRQFDQTVRTVNLEKGEAFFKVKPNPDRPFIVKVNGAEIKVLGTSFNVKRVDGATEVIVETGKVQVSSRGQVLNLIPEEKVLISENNPLLNKQKNPDLLYQYYRTHEFVASNIPLGRMIEVLNDAYDVNIVISSEKTTDLPLNITLKNEPIDAILPVIARTFNLTIEKKGGQILLK